MLVQVIARARAALGVLVPALLGSIALVSTVFAEPASEQPASISGALRFDGRALSDATSVPPRFVVVDEKRSVVVEPTVVVEGGRYSLTGLAPAAYAVNVEVDANPGNPRGGIGDMHAFFHTALVAGQSLTKDADLIQKIHLIEPEDNATPLLNFQVGCETTVKLPRAGRFTWAPLLGGASYHYQVGRSRCLDRRTWRVAEGETEGTSVTIDLPPTTDGEYYWFSLDATKGGRPVGGLGPGYEFTVD